MTVAEKPAAPGPHGLIVEAVPPKLRKLVNAVIMARGAITAGQAVKRRIEDRTRYSVTVTGDDDLYDDARAWLLDNLPPTRRRSIRAATPSRRDMDDVAVPEGPEERHVPSRPKLRLFYDGSTSQTATILGHRVKIQTEIVNPSYAGQGRASEYEAFYARQNKLVFLAQSPEARDAVLSLLSDLAARRSARPEPPRLYLASKWGHWERRDHLRPRDVSTVVLASGLAESLIADVRLFLDAESMYALLGLPWHRGYLFEGPSGTGKTTIAQAIATTFDLDVYWMPVRDVPDDSTFLRLISEVKSKGILLLEDVDVLRASHQREDGAPQTEGETPGASLQGLLNGLDGMVTPHGLITIMTTNHVDTLDDALIRAGRIDVNQHIGPLDAPDLRRLVRMLAVDVQVPDGVTAAPADVVKIVKKHMHDPAAASQAMTAWFNEMEDCS